MKGELPSLGAGEHIEDTSFVSRQPTDLLTSQLKQQGVLFRASDRSGISGSGSPGRDSNLAQQVVDAQQEKSVTIGILTIYPHSQSIQFPWLGKPVLLTEDEFRFVTTFAQTPDTAIAPEDLILRTWGPKFRGGEVTLMSYVDVLRDKLEPDPLHPQLFTYEDNGYILHLAKTKDSPVATERKERSTYTIGDLVINLKKRTLTKKGRRINLKATDFKLLRLLTENYGKGLSREFIWETIWGESSETNLANVKYRICRLREKIEDEPKHPRYIQTVRGINGYMLEDRQKTVEKTGSAIAPDESSSHFEFDREHSQILRGDIIITLTPREHLLLSTLMDSPNILLTKGILKVRVWGKNISDNTLKWYIRALRGKIGDSDKTIIESEKGLGYKYVG